MKIRAKRTFKMEDVLRKHILELKPYKPIEPFEIVAERVGLRPEHIIKLDANENVYGPPPEVHTALQDLKYAHIYPDPESRQLRRKLSDWQGVPMENILVRGEEQD